MAEMEDELIAQRDAAIAVTKELQRQLQQHREVVERTVERRALNAERLRFHADEQLRRTQEAREWEATMCGRLLYLSLFCGMIGAIFGWVCGLMVFLLLGQPLAGFLLILPAMACGAVAGFVIAKTRTQLENRHRMEQLRQSSRHSEVEMAVNHSVENEQVALEPLRNVTGHAFDATTLENSERLSSSSNETELTHIRNPPSNSWLSFGWNIASQSARTTIDLATGAYHSTTYVKEALTSTTEDPKKME